MENESSDKTLEHFSEDFAMMIEAGFIAVNQQDEPSAKKLFHAAQTLKPDSPAPLVGLGFIALNKLEVKEAERIFKEILEKHPEHELARTFLGIAYLLTEKNRKEGETLIKAAMEKTDDETVKNLGKISLEWADKDLKKTKAPFFAGG